MLPSPRSSGSATSALVLLAVALACEKGHARAGVACFDTPDWGQAGALELRAEASGALLLRYRTTAQRLREDYPGAAPGADPGQPAVARFAGPRLDRAGEADWLAAAGEVADCDRQAATSAAPFVLDAGERMLHWRERAMPVAGRTVLLLAAAPGGDRVAVLSADGSSAGTAQPFLGRAGAAGQHYHQVFSRHDATEQGQAVALPLTSEPVALSGCWSADGRYVVYSDVLYNHLCIVQPEAAGGDRR